MDDIVRVGAGDLCDGGRELMLLQLTNEFSFPIASFHHASEAWLVPDVLKRA